MCVYPAKVYYVLRIPPYLHRMPFDSADLSCHLITTILFLTHAYTCLLLIKLSERLTHIPLTKHNSNLTKHNSNSAQIFIRFSLSRLCSSFAMAPSKMTTHWRQGRYPEPRTASPLREGGYAFSIR